MRRSLEHRFIASVFALACGTSLLGCGDAGNSESESGVTEESQALPGGRGDRSSNNVDTSGGGASGKIDLVVRKSELSCFYGGDTCSTSEECCSGTCDSGVCSQRTCEAPEDCAIGGTSEGYECTSAGFCAEQCQTNDDCRHEGWVCTQGGRCVDGEGQASATVALQADLDELADAKGLGTPYKLPANASLYITDPDGDGVGLTIGDHSSNRRSVMFDGNGSQLLGAADVALIRVKRSAAYSELEDFRIDPAPALRNDPHTGIGVDVRAHGVRLQNIFVRRMGTCIRADSGIDLNGDGDADDPEEYSNLNSQQWSKLRFDSCYENAIYMDGEDANAGTMVGIEVLSGAGIRDDSFLGNTWLGVQAEGTHSHSIEMSQASQTAVVVGAYVENSDPAARSESLSSLWVGGNALARLEGMSERVGYLRSRLTFQDDSGFRVNIPGGPNAAIRFRHPDEDDDWSLMYENNWKMWMFAYGGSPLGGYAYGWTGAQHPSGPGVQEVE